METKTITIFCSSYNDIDTKYFEDVEQITRILVDNSYTIIHGGGANGLMGKVTDVALEMNGDVIGIRHRNLMEDQKEPFHKRIKKMTIPDNIEERKRLMYEKADIILVLPGGAGTLEELFYSITSNRLIEQNKKIILFNKDGFFKSLINMIDQLVSEKFMKDQSCIIISKANEIVSHL